MDIFISSDRYQREFIDVVLQEINERQLIAKETGIQIEPVYPPFGIGRRPTSIRERINQIRTASLVFMNVTPLGTIKRRINEEDKDWYILNSGVCAEFGIVLGINRTEKCHLFCSNQYEVGLISPMVHGLNIDPFDPKNPQELKTKVGTYIADYLRISTDSYESVASNATNTSGQIY